MFTEPRLVTPHGQTIVLSAAEYAKILAAISAQPPIMARPSLAEARALVNELRGKYASARSLTQALLDERRQERQREEGRAHVRFSA